MSQQADNGVHADRPRQVRAHRIARGPDCAGRDATCQPHHARRTERDGNIVVEADGNGFDQRTDGGRNHRRHEREHQRRARRHRRSRPARQRHTRNRTEHDKGRRSRDCLVTIPWKRHLCGLRGLCVPRPADERGESIAECQHAPRGGDDVESLREREDQDEDGQWIEKNAEWKAAGRVDRAIQAPPADAREHQRVEHERRDGQR